MASEPMNPPNDTHSMAIGYILWVFGFMGAHRFYYGKPITGTLWFFAGGLLLIPGMDRAADFCYRTGHLHYLSAFGGPW